MTDLILSYLNLSPASGNLYIEFTGVSNERQRPVLDLRLPSHDLQTRIPPDLQKYTHLIQSNKHIALQSQASFFCGTLNDGYLDDYAAVSSISVD